MQKTSKKNLIFCLFVEGSHHSPRQRLSLCRGPLPLLSAKNFWKKNSAHFLCRGAGVEALGKDWVFAEGLTIALGKDFLGKKYV